MGQNQFTYVLNLLELPPTSSATSHGRTIKAGASTATHPLGICPRWGPWWLLQQCVRETLYARHMPCILKSSSLLLSILHPQRRLPSRYVSHCHAHPSQLSPTFGTQNKDPDPSRLWQRTLSARAAQAHPQGGGLRGLLSRFRRHHAQHFLHACVIFLLPSLPTRTRPFRK